MAKRKRAKVEESEAPEVLRRRIEELERANRELDRANQDLVLENLTLRWEVERWGRRPRQAQSDRGTKLRSAFEGVVGEWRPAFGQERVFERGRRLAYGFLLNMGRHTITGALSALCREHEAWGADYRVFSEARFESEKLFTPLLRRSLARSTLPFFAVGLDDSQFRKTGKMIPHCQLLRDPLSPPYHPNLRWACRFLQISALVWSGEAEPARGIPIGFRLAPAPKKPGKRATEAMREAYAEAQKTQTLGHQAARMMVRQRELLDALPEGRAKPVLVCVDASLASRPFLGGLPQRTEFLARIRSDAALWSPAPDGGRRVYGDRLPTPHAILRNADIAWREVTAYAAGRNWTFRVKEVGPVLWKHTTRRKRLRLIVIEPVPYRTRAGCRRQFREPAYLLTSDVNAVVKVSRTPVEKCSGFRRGVLLLVGSVRRGEESGFLTFFESVAVSPDAQGCRVV